MISSTMFTENALNNKNNRRGRFNYEITKTENHSTLSHNKSNENQNQRNYNPRKQVSHFRSLIVNEASRKNRKDNDISYKLPTLKTNDLHKIAKAPIKTIFKELKNNHSRFSSRSKSNSKFETSPTSKKDQLDLSDTSSHDETSLKRHKQDINESR